MLAVYLIATCMSFPNPFMDEALVRLEGTATLSLPPLYTSDDIFGGDDNSPLPGFLVHQHHHLPDFIDHRLEVLLLVANLAATGTTSIHITHAGRLPRYSARGTYLPNAVYYTIQMDLHTIYRRYLEFDSLRQLLVRLFPTRYIPAIPAKHLLVLYLLGANGALQLRRNLAVVEARQRQLERFLQEITTNHALHFIRQSVVFCKFVDPSETLWEEVLRQPPLSLIPSHPLMADPIHPASSTGVRLLLPIPTHTQVLKFAWGDDTHEQMLAAAEGRLGEAEHETGASVKLFDKLDSGTAQLIRMYIDLGGHLNNYALTVESMGNRPLAVVLERFGSTIDTTFLQLEAFQKAVARQVHEPFGVEVHTRTHELQRLLQYVRLKKVQAGLVEKRRGFIESRREAILEAVAQHERLQEALERGSDLSPLIAEAIKRYEEGRQGRERQWRMLAGVLGSGGAMGDVLGSADSRRLERLELELANMEQLVNVSRKDAAHVAAAVVDTVGEQEAAWAAEFRTVMKAEAKSFQIMGEETLRSWQGLRDVVEDM